MVYMSDLIFHFQRDELTNILMSRGRIKPSLRFMTKLNTSVKETSTQLMDDICSFFEVTPRIKEKLMIENSAIAILVGSAVYMYGNNAKTFVEQAKISGTPTLYSKYLEEKGLADKVPRMEPEYLNPSPWAEKESYEQEFNDILKQVKKRVQG